MKLNLGTALASAAIIGLAACASGKSTTKTASNDTGTTQSGSLEGTQGTAGGAVSGQVAASNGSTPTTGDTSGAGNTGSATTSGMGGSTASNDQGTAGTTSGTAQNPSASGSTSTGTVGSSTYGTTPPPSANPSMDNSASTALNGAAPSDSGIATPGNDHAMGSTGVGNSTGTTSDNSASAPSSMDRSADATTGLKSVTGQVAKVDQDQGSITLDQAAGGVTLTIDSQTKVLRRGHTANGISSIREGEQVRASFDPSSNRADKIEIMGKGHGMRHHGAMNGGGVGDNKTAPSTSGIGRTSTDSPVTPAAPSGTKTDDLKSGDTSSSDKK